MLKKNGKELNTKDAEIFLAELPFLRLRDKILSMVRVLKNLFKKARRRLIPQ